VNTFFSAIEAKVKASTTAATVTALVLGVLGSYVWHGAMPGWVELIVNAVVIGGLTGVAGWLAKHTPRAPDAPVAPVVPGPGSGPTPVA
jgi:hypothetical protein